MDSTNNNSGIDQTYRMLALCARAESHPRMVEQLSRQIANFTAWDELPTQAELHGMAPLLWHHIRRAGISIPLKTEQTLRGLYLRQRVFNQAHIIVLLEINSLFKQAGIHPLLLKGLALAYQYYPDPGLRPVSDLDLLFKQADVLPALDLLAGAGFRIDSLHTAPKLIPKELTADSPLKDGISVRVELHHYNPQGRHEKGNSPDPEFNGFNEPPQIITIEKNIIYTSTHLETLYYLFRHLTKHLFIGCADNPAQLKWAADIISLVELHAKELDWAHLQRHHPDIINRLEILYSLTPLPEHLEKIIPIKQSAHPSGLNQYPPGWPHRSIQQWKQVGFLRFVWQVFIPPSDWWIRLHYGIKERPLFWHRHIIYRMQILKSLFWVMMHKIEEFTAKQKLPNS